MARVPMRTREPGDHMYYKQGLNVTTETLNNGSTRVSSSNKNIEEASCGRFGLGKSPKTTVAGVPNIRRATSYRMYAWDVKHTPRYSKFTYANSGTSPTAVKSVTYSTYYGGTLNHYWHPYGGSRPSWSSVDVINMLNEATTKALLKLGDRKVNYSASAAEARSAFTMFAGNTLRLTDALLAVKRGNFREAARQLRVRDWRRLARKDLNRASGKFLEFSYGWLPLCNDIAGSIDLWQEVMRKKPLTLSSVGRVSAESTVRPFSANGLSGQIGGKIDVEVGLLARLSDTYERIAAQSGVFDPISAGWELIPFSFVVDWVVPIGDLIEALQATACLQQLIW